jgi:hypothetical protein
LLISDNGETGRLPKKPLSLRLINKVQMQGGAR